MLGAFERPQIGPDAEFTRSDAARAVRRMADASGLFAAHFEHRLELELPEWWCVPDADLGPYPWEMAQPWQSGGLHETKFRTFRLDRRVASFHPSHAPKWGAHELCHGLVGFGWKPGASMLWLATAARLAELAPVALWYFFDEAGLSRCTRHQGQGALFGPPCPDCERRSASVPGADHGPDVQRWRQRGAAFVEAEIDAAWQTLERGVPVSNRYGTIDLCTDGLAYARAHRPVLADPVFASWVERFCSFERGWHDDLDGLIARIRDVVAAMSGEGDAEPLDAHAGTWAAQDVGWRLLALQTETDGAVADALEAMVDRLAEAAGGATVDDTMHTMASVIAEYEHLYAEVVLPSPHDMFAVGYPLPGGHGASHRQLTEGLEAVLPITCARLGSALEESVAAFAASDSLVRAGIGDRFADWARRNLPGAVADQAALEAAVMHVQAPDPSVHALRGAARPGATWRGARHVRPVLLHHDVGTEPDDPGTGESLDAPAYVAVVRALDGTRELVGLDPVAYDCLQSVTTTDGDRPLSPAVAALADAGMLEPDAWMAAEAPSISGASS